MSPTVLYMNHYYGTTKNFLKDYMKPRKSQTSLQLIEENPDSQQDTENVAENERIEVFDVSHIIEYLPVDIDMDNNLSLSYTVDYDHSLVVPHSTSLAVPSTSTPAQATATPSCSTCPAVSTASSRNSGEKQGITPKRKRRDSWDADYAGAIHELAQSLEQPITIGTMDDSANKSSDLVEPFVNFVRSVLRTIQDEEVKWDLMNNITEMVMKAKSADGQHNKK